MKKILFTVISFFVINIGYSQIVYSFIGNGNWSDTNNWYNRSKPPTKLLGGDTIYIESNTTCHLDVKQTIELGAALIVETGADFDVMNNLTLQKNTDSIQYLIVTVDSIYNDTLFFDSSGTIDNGSDGDGPVAIATYVDTSSIKETWVYIDPSWAQDPVIPTNVFDNILTIDSLPGVYNQGTTIVIDDVPDSVKQESRIYYIDTPFQIHITEYDSVGGYFSGSFSAVSHYYNVNAGGLVQGGPVWVYTDHLITCKFRTHRAGNDANPYIGKY